MGGQHDGGSSVIVSAADVEGILALEAEDDAVLVVDANRIVAGAAR